MYDDFQERDDAIATYMRHRAKKYLAEKMDLLFRPLTYIPISNLDREVQKAITPSDFWRVAFARLLRGETQQARRYLQGASALDHATYGLVKIILDNLDEVQQIVTASRDDFNKLRVEKYRRRPF